MQFLQDGTEFCQLIYADYLDDNGNYILADDTRLDATDPQEDSDWCWEYRLSGVCVGGYSGSGGGVGGGSVAGGYDGGGGGVGGYGVCVGGGSWWWL